MRTAVDEDDAERVAVLVEEDQLGRGLDDLSGRSHARHAVRLAVERRILLDALAIEILHALPELGLVHRLIGRTLVDARVALRVDARMAFARVDLRLVAEARRRQLHDVALLIRLHAAAAARPEAGEVRMAVGRARRRDVLLRSSTTATLRMNGNHRDGRGDGDRRREARESHSYPLSCVTMCWLSRSSHGKSSMKVAFGFGFRRSVRGRITNGCTSTSASSTVACHVSALPSRVYFSMTCMLLLWNQPGHPSQLSSLKPTMSMTIVSPSHLPTASPYHVVSCDLIGSCGRPSMGMTRKTFPCA